MQCIKCGAAIEDGFQVCKKCGTPVNSNDLNSELKLENIPNINTLENSNVSTEELVVETIDTSSPVLDNVSNNAELVSVDDTPTFEEVLPVEKELDESISSNNQFHDNLEISSNDKSTNVEPIIMSTSNDDLSNINNDLDIHSSDNDSDEVVYSDKSKFKYIVVGIMGLLIVVIALICVKFIPTKETEVKIDEPVENIVTYNKLSFKNFLFSIPDKYVFSTKGDVLSISDTDGNVGMQIEISSGEYSKLVSKKEELSKALEKKGFVSSKADTRKEDGIEYLTMEVSASGQNILLAVTKGNASNYFTVSLFNKSNNIDYKLLEEVTKFLKLTEEVKSNNKITSKNTYGKEFESIAK